MIGRIDDGTRLGSRSELRQYKADLGGRLGFTTKTRHVGCMLFKNREQSALGKSFAHRIAYF